MNDHLPDSKSNSSKIDLSTECCVHDTCPCINLSISGSACL